MYQHLLLLVLLLVTQHYHVTHAAYCHGAPSPNATANTQPIYLNVQPKFIGAIKNGKLFSVEQGMVKLNLIHVYGSAYEMGFAHGTLLKSDIQAFYNTVWPYLLRQIEDNLKNLPQWLQHLIAQEGMDIALDVTHELTKHYTGDYFFEELRGISDAAQVDYKMMRRVHLIGELTKGHCSMVGAWGKATLQGTTLQLRSLDWDVNGPFKDHATIVVYHSNGTTNSFANVGFSGWIGAITGMSDKRMAISEIGVYFNDDTFGSESRVGIPFTYLLRDILQFDKTLDDSINRISSAKRTCNLILGVGDGKLRQFRGFQYSSSVANVMDDINMKPANDSWHPRIPNTVYYGMDWNCPGYNKVLGEQVQRFHGNITPENIIREINARTQSGNLQSAVYDLTNNNMYISYARPSTQQGTPKNAYERPFVQFDMSALFDEPAP